MKIHFVLTLVEFMLVDGKIAGVVLRLLTWMMASAVHISHSLTEAGCPFLGASCCLELEATVLIQIFPGSLLRTSSRVCMAAKYVEEAS